MISSAKHDILDLAALVLHAQQ